MPTPHQRFEFGFSPTTTLTRYTTGTPFLGMPIAMRRKRSHHVNDLARYHHRPFGSGPSTSSHSRRQAQHERELPSAPRSNVSCMHSCMVCLVVLSKSLLCCRIQSCFVYTLSIPALFPHEYWQALFHHIKSISDQIVVRTN
jgi:hypothetical protein